MAFYVWEDGDDREDAHKDKYALSERFAAERYAARLWDSGDEFDTVYLWVQEECNDPMLMRVQVEREPRFEAKPYLPDLPTNSEIKVVCKSIDQEIANDLAARMARIPHESY